jgi:M6 family metalloprotease-like protein
VKPYYLLIMTLLLTTFKLTFAQDTEPPDIISTCVFIDDPLLDALPASGSVHILWIVCTVDSGAIDSNISTSGQYWCNPDSVRIYLPSTYTMPYWKDIVLDPNNQASLSRYFEDVSGGDLVVTGDVVGWNDSTVFKCDPDPTKLPTMPEHGCFGSNTGGSAYFRNIMQKVDSVVDFNDYDLNDDGVVDYVIFNLYGLCEDPWICKGGGVNMLATTYTSRDSLNGSPVRVTNGHSQWTGSDEYAHPGDLLSSLNPAVGVAAHEMGHKFSPRADRVDHWAPTPFGEEHWAFGGYDVMAGSAGFPRIDGNGHHRTGPASPYNPESRVRIGWTEPVVVDRPFSEVEIGNYTGTNELLYIPAYVNSNAASDQSFYIELSTRQSYWESTWPSQGFLVWHVDPTVNNMNHRRHKTLDLEAASGLFDWDLHRGYLCYRGNYVLHDCGVNTLVENSVSGLDSFDIPAAWGGDSTSSYWMYGGCTAHVGRGVGSPAQYFTSGSTFSYNTNPSSAAYNDTLQNRVTMGHFEVIEVDSLNHSGAFTAWSRHWQGTVVDDVTWLDSIVVDNNLTLSSASELTILPGTKIVVDANASITINGSLIAEGTSGSPIIFRAKDAGERWNGLTINGGSVDMDYVNFRDFKDHGLYVESPDAVSISNVDLNCSGLKYQGIGLRLWNSPTVTQSVSNLTVHSVPADSQIAGMYLYNCKVNFSGVTIEDCDWINSYIKKITGNFRGCTFQDRTEYYGVLFGSTPNVPNFRCCDFANLAPPTGNWPTTIYCYAGTSPSFGGEGDTGGSGVSNVITDESDYLMIMRGSLALPVVDSDPPQPPYVGTSNGGKNNWKNLQTGGKYFQWVDPGTTTYPCTEQWWANGVDSTMFTPSTPARWDFDPEASVEWGLCGGGEGGGIEDSYNGGEIARNNGDNLDDNEYDDILKTAFVFEADEDYAAAQELFRYVAENSPDTYQRWTALSHVVVCEAFIGTGQSWVPDLLTDLIEGESSYEAHVQGERLRVSFYQNREEYENAIEYCVDLLNSGLTYEDSIHVAMDLMGLQMSAEVGGGSLDGMSATQLIPVELKAQNDSEALQIERSLFALLNSGHEGEQDSKSLPDEFKLHDAYPNPFNSNTTITFEIPVTTNGSLKIFNIRGQLVETLMSGTLTAGYHSINYNAENLSTGLYFYRLEWGDHSVTKKMLLLR